MATPSQVSRAEAHLARGIEAREGLDFSRAIRKRDEALDRIERVTSDDFRERGQRFVLSYLAAHGPTPGEVLTEQGEKIGGLRSSDARHWGHVIRALSTAGKIHCVGFVPRCKGHGTAGGRVWSLA